MAILAERLPRELQVQQGALIQSLGQAGRAIGPLIGTTLYGVADVYLPGAAPNAAMIFLVLFLFIAVGFPLTHARLMYGSCSDLSKAQQRRLMDGNMLVV